ncbi:MAG: alkaline phosphatase D family protein [Pseudomonadota bacterium]|nr:alkaline phosphatase D family protein [Pseudomonadota bacterium]
MNLSRRSLLKLLAASSASIVVSSGLQGCDFTNADSENIVSFDHGVASGDPLQDSVILWTRVTPSKTEAVSVGWEVATDVEFIEQVNSGQTIVDDSTDYTLKIDVTGLSQGTVYFYRFITGETVSPVGQTKTLASSPEQAKFAVMTCANYPAGFFHVYQDVANRADEFDVVLHLGDYIYEYGIDGYPEAGTGEDIGRIHYPLHECLSLTDYRQRYAQYHSDLSLQALHSKLPFICVWDDHEIADDSYTDGALNHTPNTEGVFEDRKVAAIQAWYEWLPVRAPLIEADKIKTFRQFEFGDILTLMMLDTRVIARDRQLNYLNYIDLMGNFLYSKFVSDWNLEDRSLLGQEQLSWLFDSMIESKGNGVIWQVLGQQVMMAKTEFPSSMLGLEPIKDLIEYHQVATAYQTLTTLVIGTLTDYGTVNDYAETIDGFETMSLAEQAAALTRALQEVDPEKYDSIFSNLSEEDQQFLITRSQLLDLQTNPFIPYNLDAWDGYPYERELVFEQAKALEANLLVLTGDTHNAFCNYLTDQFSETVGIEFVTSSISAPGMEVYLDIPIGEEAQGEEIVLDVVEDMQFIDCSQRGYLEVEFNREQAIGKWYAMPRSGEKNPKFTPLELQKTYSVNAGEKLLNG